MTVAAATALMAFFACGLYGWGAAARRMMGLPDGTWPVTIVIGLAGWIAIGGVLNLLHIAYPATICLLLVAGCALAAATAWSRRHPASAGWLTPKGAFDRFYPVAWLGISVVIVSVAIVTQAAPRVFNHHDDYQKYFAHVARMLQTGTLSGSPLNTLGSETLGGQAFLQALFAGLLPFPAINTADAVFCFGLTVLLAGGVAWRRPAAAPAALLAMVATALIEPQYVSVTALYSAAALMLAVVALSIDRREYASSTSSRHSPPAAAIGLLYAALVALKPTFALFVVLHFVLCASADALVIRCIAVPLRRALATAGWGLLFIAPWVALYSPLYWSALTAAAPGLAEAPVPAARSLDLLSTTTLYYGGSYGQYTFIAAMFIVCGAIQLVRRGPPQADVYRYIAICVAVPAAYLVMLLAMAPLLAGYGTALRHVLPVLIGTAPAILALGGLLAAPDTAHRRNLVAVATAGLAAILVAWSVPDLAVRLHLWARTGSMLAYLRNARADVEEELVANSRAILEQPSVAQRLAEMQRRVPPGEPVLVWVNAPFLLDFKRNRIIDADIGGLSNPWSRTPRVSYVLWQYAGFAVRQPEDYVRRMRGAGRRETYLAARGLAYITRLEEMRTRSQIIVDDGSTVLFRIAPDAELP